MTRLNSIAEFEQERDTILQARATARRRITVCGGRSCAISTDGLRTALETALNKSGLDTQAQVVVTGCPGFCEQGPFVIIGTERILYTKVTPGDAPEIVAKTIGQNEVVERLLYQDPHSGRWIVHEEDVPFYKEQHRLLMKNNGMIDPTRIEDYIAQGGYKGLACALAMTPENVVQEIKRSGLRGRGGAGFPTGLKWETCRQVQGDIKYVICNADEANPGAFQDRSLVDGNPHGIVEGMIIGAYAIGAREGFVYIRHDYPATVDTLRRAIQQAGEWGLLGRNILGSGFDFDLHVHLSAGAFVCGEETALIASIEGRVSEPVPRPPFPAEKGLWGKPTNINNAKTWAAVPYVLSHGADSYANLGTEKSKGTTVFSLGGKINHAGLVEVPMGVTLRHIIYDIGGGIRGGKEFKAVQPGGPSGGCIPEDLLDLPVDYESLTAAGSMMGSGGLIVMDEDTCMVQVARYFTDFNRVESCGKCTACREGVKQMHTLLTGITTGQGKESDIALLEELGQTIKDGALCGLGKAAPNPVLTTIRYFRSEYEAHIRDKQCPAKVCYQDAAGEK
jgi:NADH-quinone oxidoreductase subunit F